MKNIKLRQAKLEDLEFLYKVSTDSMKYVRDTLGSKNKTFEEYREKFNPDEVQIIQFEDKSVGRLRVVRSTESIYIGGIQILPEYQGIGIGTQIIDALILESKELNIPITLEVHEVNSKAKSFYDNLGFRLEKVVGEKLSLKYTPN